MTLSVASTPVPDLLRLLAVPVFAWAAVRDVKTRRVSSDVWMPLSLLALVTLVWDAWAAWTAGPSAWHEFLVPATISVGFVAPLAYLFWWFGGFGGADAKALLVLAVLFPTFPAYAVGPWEFPLTATPVGAFSFTILTNAVLVGVTVPVALAVRNAVAGRIAPVMFVGWPIRWESVPGTHGRLLQTPEGLSRGGLDLDALRMYLRWRGLDLAEVRANPDRYRDPATLPDDPNPPTDGAVNAAVPDGSGPIASEGESTRPADGADAIDDSPTSYEFDDPWGAAAFLESIEGSAYGTTPGDLRDGLDALVAEETVWISPGTPFLVPVFVGLAIALVYGDLLVTLAF